MGLNVLSLFDGISCGQYALQKADIAVDKYYASEIDQRAIKVTQKNWPKTIQYGSVKYIHTHHFMSTIDLLIGGSPCQDLSIAGKMAGINGERSKLFFEYIRLLNELRNVNPNLKFFFENVRCRKADQDIISSYLGVEPIYFDSAITSAQTRKRLYWTNIVSKEDFVYPQDCGIVLADILEFGDETYYSVDGSFKPTLKSNTIDANYHKGLGANQTRSCVKIVETECNYEKQGRVYSPQGKSPAIDTQSGGGRGVKIANVNPSGKGMNGNVYSTEGKAPTLTTNKGEGIKIEKKALTITATYGSAVERDYTEKRNRQLIPLKKVITHSSQPRNGKGQGGKGHLQKEDGKTYCIDTTCSKMVEYEDTYRKLTPIEVERCFNLPDNYTAGISNSARYHALGNGWEIGAIVEFFKHLKHANSKI